MKIIKRLLLGFFLLIIVIILGFFSVSYYNYSTDKNPYKNFIIPRINILDIEIANLADNRIDLLLKMGIDSHLPIVIKVDSIQYEIKISNKEVVKSSSKKSITIHPGNDNLLSLPLTIFDESLTDILKKSEKQGADSVWYEFKASFFVSSHFFRKSMDFDEKKWLPLIYIPKVTVDKIEIDSLRFSGVTLLVHSTLINKNVFPLDAIDMHDRFEIGGNPWVDARVPGLMKIPPHSKTESVIPFRISFKEMAHTLPELIKKGKNLDYKLEVNFKINSKDNTTNHSKVKLGSKGSIKELIRYYKTLKGSSKKK